MHIQGATVLLFFDRINKLWEIVTGDPIYLVLKFRSNPLGHFLRSDSIGLHQTNQTSQV
jgi:hypothetical protein